MTKGKRLVGTIEVCKLLGGQGGAPVAPSTLYRFVKMGMPKVGPNLYDKADCSAWYIGRLRRLEIQRGQRQIFRDARRRLRSLPSQVADELARTAPKDIEHLLAKSFDEALRGLGN